MSNTTVIITDDVSRSTVLAKAVGKHVPAHLVELTKLSDLSDQDFHLLIIDIDLMNADSIALIRAFFARLDQPKPKIFLTSNASRLQVVQSRALGASSVIARPLKYEALINIIEYYTKNKNEDSLDDGKVLEISAYKGVVELNDSIIQAIDTAKKLPKNEVHLCSKLVISSLEENGVSSWMETIKNHHSYTYRHSMSVTGYGVAFGLHFGMRYADIKRLAIAALLHDVGKARIPLAILDKPVGLTPDERALFRQHPIFSGEILVKDGQFEYEVVDVALHHHEHLDGSGYPDGLAGDQICDLVRVISIIDTFALLTERRAYKQAIPDEEAYRMMLAMKDKLDMDLLKAFEPIALKTSPVMAPDHARRSAVA